MKTKILQPGKYYHIYNRAKNGDPLFENEEDWKFFLKLYRAHVMPVATTFAYCLLRDHLHILVRIREDTEGSSYRPFAILFNAYAKGYGKKHGIEGRLFRYKLKRMEIRRESVFLDLVRYINQNACKHGYTDDIDGFRYSSFRSTITPFETMIPKDELIVFFGGITDLREELMQPVDENNLRPFLMEE